MNADRGAAAQGADVPPVQESGGGFWVSLIEIFIDPQKVFSRIARGLEWWKPFIVVALLTVALSYFQQPISVKVIELNVRGLTAEQLEVQRQAMERFGFVSMIIAPIAVLVMSLVIALLVNVTVNLASGRSGFWRILCLLQFAGLIGFLEQGLKLIVIHLRGIETVEALSDLRVSFGLAALPRLAETEGFVFALLESLSVFQIWYLIVLTFGIAAIFGIGRGRVVPATIVVWLIGLAMLSLGNLGMRG